MPNAGNSGGSGGRGGGRGEGGGDFPRRRRGQTLLDLVEQMHFVEGQEAKLGTLAGGKATARAIKAQQTEFDKQFNLRKKIKPIRDPDDVVSGKKKATRRKQRGRVGTTTLSNAETLG